MADGDAVGVAAHNHWHFRYAYLHTEERLWERYRLLLTQEIWDDWHAAILTNREDALYIKDTKQGCEWRVSVDGEAVFVVIHGGVIRTVIPRTGKHIHEARDAAAKIGETSLGYKIPKSFGGAQPVAKKAVASENKFGLLSKEELAELHETAHQKKMERIKEAGVKNQTQAELFVQMMRSRTTKAEFTSLWDQVRAMFPGDPAWTPPKKEKSE